MIVEQLSIHETDKHEAFKFDANNRNIIRHNIRKFKEEFLRVGYCLQMPIIITKEFTVIDGQHRLLAIKELFKEKNIRIKFSYVFSDLDSVVPYFQGGKSWSRTDFVYYHAKKGKEEYQTLINLFEDYRDVYDSMDKLLNAVVNSSGESFNKKIRTGASFFEDAITNFEVLRDFTNFIRNCLVEAINKDRKKTLRSRNTLRALFCFYQLPEFSTKRMLDAIRQYPTLLFPTRTVQESKEIINELYNYRLKIRVNLIESDKNK